MSNTFSDQVVIVTGASEGIGRATALALAAQGAKVVAAARNHERLGSLQQECGSLPGDCLPVVTDVTDQAACVAMVKQAVDWGGRLDTLINNAGMTMWAGMDDVTDLSLVMRLMEINYAGGVYCTAAALPHLKQSRGRLAAVASIAGIIGVPGHALYAATKHAIMGYYNSMRIELAKDGVSVSLLAPDFVVTETHFRGFRGDGAPMEKRLDPATHMSAEKCANIFLKGLGKRQRFITTSTRAQLALAFRDWLPDVVDGITAKKSKEHDLT